MRLLLLSSLLLLASPAQSEDEAVQSLARVLAANMDRHQLITHLAERAYFQAMFEVDIPAAQRDAVGSRLVAAIRARVEAPEFLERVTAQWLADNFHDAELRELMEFSRTSAGRKVIPRMLPGQPDFVMFVRREIESDLTAAIHYGLSGPARAEPLGKRTAADMRTLATAAEAYATDHNQYPDARNIDELVGHISPIYIRSAPKKDAWGNPFRYIVTPDLQQYRIISAGADGIVDAHSESPTLSVLREPKRKPPKIPKTTSFTRTAHSFRHPVTFSSECRGHSRQAFTASVDPFGRRG